MSFTLMSEDASGECPHTALSVDIYLGIFFFSQTVLYT